METVAKLGYEQVLRALDEQRAALAGFHQRAAGLLAATAGVATLGTGLVLTDETSGWAVVPPMLVAMLGGFAAVRALMPRTVEFYLSPMLLQTFGHLEGDDLLTAVAQRLEETVAKNERALTGSMADHYNQRLGERAEGVAPAELSRGERWQRRLSPSHPAGLVRLAALLLPVQAVAWSLVAWGS